MRIKLGTQINDLFAQIAALQEILSEEIEVCHEGVTKIVNLGGLGGHLNHGDAIGPC